MTLEKFNYRTNPLFLRNEFDSANSFGIPDVPKAKFTEDELRNLLMLGFNQLKKDDGKHSERIVHFFLYDYNFEKVWKKPELYLKPLSQYKGILTPDFSMYIEMPYTIQLYNTFRNRWCGKGIEKGSVIAVSTYMFHESNHHKDQKELFMKGYNKMLSEIEPEKIICYSEPFSEMKGDIIYVNYELSSWKYLNDIKVNSLTRQNKSDIIIKKYGYVCKGGGSAYGGEWKPKDKNSARFLGKPNAIKENTVKTTKGSYKVLDYYDEEGKIAAERHLTDHNKAHQHSNPHDHLINWDNNFPNMSQPINYKEGVIPTFEEFINSSHSGKVFEYIEGDEKSMKNYEYNPADHKFETLGEFKFYLSCGANVGFKYNGIYYGIEGHNNNFEIWIYDKEDIAVGLTLEQTLDFEFDGVKLRDFITTDDVEITERIM
ncbi:hypothetical protein Osc2_00850 [Ruminococcus sp. 25CYCFAH16]